MAVVPPPLRNRSILGVFVHAHSGEFAPMATDLRLRGRGLDLELVRSYRSSLADRAGELGRGWSLNLAKRVERAKDDLVYHDGAGLAHRFVREEEDRYAPPPGFYGTIAEQKRSVVIRHRFGIVSRFDLPERGGRLRSVTDRNDNAIAVAYGDDRIDVLDSLRRPLTVTLAEGRITEIEDHAGRTWRYAYDSDERLVEVVQPATAAFPQGTSVGFGYDASHRLVSLTDAKGQTWLTVAYDDAGRVVEQRHGSGTYGFDYEVRGRGRAARVRTTCRLRNGGVLVVEHNAIGNPVRRTLWVRRDAFAPEDLGGAAEDRVPLVTMSAYNGDSELVELVEPAGNSTAWEYAEGEKDPRNRGSCVRRTETPAPGAPADQAPLVTTWKHDREFQAPLSVTDARGHTTTYRYDSRGNRIATAFAPVTVQPVAAAGKQPPPETLGVEVRYAFNSRGQLLAKTHADGTVTAYEYYPLADPTGDAGPGTATRDPEALCGYLARVTLDATGAHRRHEFRWDAFGNIVASLDGTRNAARRRYDALGRLEAVVGREPFADTIDYRYDANGNEVESLQPFERLELDEATGTPVTRAATLRELREYDALDNLVARTLAGGEMRITERFAWDADERLVRIVQPHGTATELEYDERGLVVAVTRAAGTKEAMTERRTYTRNGALRTVTDGNGGKTTIHYDGFERECGLTDAVGTVLTRRLDEAGNVVGVAVNDPGAAADDAAEPLLEATYEYDEWDRVVRVDEAWRDADGKPIGASGWDGREGVVSSVVEYGPDGRAARVWQEGGNVVAVVRDGAGRVAVVEGATGETLSFRYDDNGNQIESRYRGQEGEGECERAEAIVRLRYDAMDRLVGRQEEDAAPERLEYDAFGAVVAHVRPSGMVVRLLHDALGRRTGQVISAGDADDAERITRRLEFDDAYRVVAHTDAAGRRTTYRYDALDRQVGVVYPDGVEATAEYDGNGNVVRTVDPAGTETVITYDAGDRLVERRTRRAGSDADDVETFVYDAVGRLVRATAGGRELRRTYDSLSRVLTEDQAGRTVRTGYDAAGRPVALEYPGGESVRRTFDAQGRVTRVATADGEEIASVEYRAGEQVRRLVLGAALEARCTYDAQERLESITYRRLDDDSVVEGYSYARDDAGRIAHEVQASDGTGQRFWFDAFNRPVRARYGVEDVLDPASPFEHETTYTWFPDGPWRTRRDTDGSGALVADQAGMLNERNRYRRLGRTAFAYDAAGNVVRKGTDNPGFCLYTYDGQNRLVKVECYDRNAQRTKTIEYEYDALGRLVRTVVTDAAGVATETTYVWAGTTLLEEYENGVLVRTYVYSIASQPARLTVDDNGRSDYLFVHDGRGVVVGLVKANDPNAFAERYGYEITGTAYLKEVDGVAVELPERATKVSSLWNSILSGDAFGSLMKDWASGTVTGADGRHLDPMIADVLNTNASLTGGVHTTLKATMGKQFSTFLGMLGLGSRNGFISHGGSGGQGTTKDSERTSSSGGSGKSGGGRSEGGNDLGLAGIMRDFSLYAAGGDSPTNVNLTPSSGQPAWADFKGGGGGASGTSGGSGGSSSGGLIGEVKGFLNSDAGKVATEVGKVIAVSLATSKASESAGGPPKGEDPHKGNEAEQRAKEEQDKAKREQQEKEKQEKEQQEKLAKENAERKKKEEEGKKKSEEGKKAESEDGKKKSDKKYFDPDQQSYTTIAITPEQLEMRLNGRKRPVDPNTDGGSPQVDTSSPPPHHGGIDPTIARFDGEVYGGVSLEAAETKLSIAPIDYHPDREPLTPTGPPTGGGDDTDGDRGHP
jgi:YD repeat-containing protein